MKKTMYKCDNCGAIHSHKDSYNDQYCYDCIDIETGKLKVLHAPKELSYCDKCTQMTNHNGDTCLKCATPKEEEILIAQDNARIEQSKEEESRFQMSVGDTTEVHNKLFPKKEEIIPEITKILSRWELPESAVVVKDILDLILNIRREAIAEGEERVKRVIKEVYQNAKEDHICRFNDGDCNCECYYTAINDVISHLTQE